MPTDGAGAQSTLVCPRAVWADLLSERSTLREATDSEAATVLGDPHALRRTLACFDLRCFADGAVAQGGAG